MTTYFYGIVPSYDDEGQPQDKIICLSAENMLASLVYTNKPTGYTFGDVRQILGDNHFDPEEEIHEAEEFDGDDEHYQYPQIVMLSDLPKALSELGEVNSGRTDSWLDITASSEKDMLQVARQHNLTMIRDDALALAINPFAGESNRLSREEFVAAVERLQQHTT